MGSKKRNLCILGVVGIIFVIVSLIVGGYFLYKSNHKTKIDNNAGSNSSPGSSQTYTTQKPRKSATHKTTKSRTHTPVDSFEAPKAAKGKTYDSTNPHSGVKESGSLKPKDETELDRFKHYDGLKGIKRPRDGFHVPTNIYESAESTEISIKYTKASFKSEYICNGQPRPYDVKGAVAAAIYYSAQDRFDDGVDKIGIMIAGNSGLPLGKIGRHIMNGQWSDIETEYTPQEESIILEWFRAEGQMEYKYKTTSTQVCGAQSNGKCKKLWNIVGGKWGMKQQGGTSFDTIQGIDYRKGKDPKIYDESWVVKDAIVSRHNGKDIKATLVFVSGPNAAAGGSNLPSSTVFRTKNIECEKEYTAYIAKSKKEEALFSKYMKGNSAAMPPREQYLQDKPKMTEYITKTEIGSDFFKNSVQNALRSGLDAMIREGVTIALIARVSTGIYAGEAYTKLVNRKFSYAVSNPFRQKVNSKFEKWVEDVLNEPISINDGKHTKKVARGSMFKIIDIPKI